MKVKQFLKHLYTKATYVEKPHYIANVSAPIIDVYNKELPLNNYERLICNFANRVKENPDLYKEVNFIQNHYEVSLDKVRLNFWKSPMRPKKFHYEWCLDVEKLDQQALFPEYVEGKPLWLIYNFDVRPEYGEFIKSFFGKKEEELMDELL